MTRGGTGKDRKSVRRRPRPMPAEGSKSLKSGSIELSEAQSYQSDKEHNLMTTTRPGYSFFIVLFLGIRSALFGERGVRVIGHWLLVARRRWGANRTETCSLHRVRISC
jgi:hypothetical protein